jgi:PhzF family phenazine biosynthesis protein
MFVVDAFTAKPFAGNPAAVCILPDQANERCMQSVASEMNLSETAFLVPRTDGFGLRWFTPSVEVALCGHATLASAHVLWETKRLPADQTAHFRTKSGLLTADQRGPEIELDFPACPPTQCAEPPGLLAALGVSAEFIGANSLDYFVVLSSAQAVRELKPDHAKLAKLPLRGVIVTAKSDDSRCDFVSRFFAPGSGVPEDPVTGSAHCCLGPFWAERLGKQSLVGFQASQRTGVVGVCCDGERVKLTGRAITVLRGEIDA